MKKVVASNNEFAWHVHDGLSDWTARVDTKASIALAIEAATLGFCLTLISKDGLLSQIDGWGFWTLRSGVLALVLAVIFAITVVIPQLHGRRSKQQYRDNFIYFGHLRHWDPPALTKRLQDEPLSKSALARQLVTMSKIVWRKHVWLQWSLTLYLIALGLLLVSFAAPTAPPSAATHSTTSKTR